jgi:diguanylate cyclase (GGDEF)-like protein
VLNSIAYERKQSALTDATTDLPNERAFYLILENQIAETQRKIDERPLTILTIDIKDFADINLQYGHGAGDLALNAAARIIKDNLRQMDFFARAADDEFLAILPTASKAVSYDVVARICSGFFGRKLKISETDSVELHLNFGWAAFGEDGETASQLLKAARIRKAQKKSLSENKVLWFLKDNPENPDLASVNS